MSTMETLELDSADLASTTWLKVKGQVERLIEKARARNDNPLPPEETAALRGEIKALKALLRLGQEKPPAMDG